MDDQEIRMRIVEALCPVSSKYELNGTKFIDKCKEVEVYVKGQIRAKPRTTRNANK